MESTVCPFCNTSEPATEKIQPCPFCRRRKQKRLEEGVKKEFQNPEGGLNKKGREHFKRTEGANLKPPVSKEKAKKSPKSAKRRKSFCARMGGQKKMHNIDCRQDPDKDICKSLRKWDCNESYIEILNTILS